jgi:hypothetical protein
MMLSIYFSLEELIFSSTGERLGIDNTPPNQVIINLKHLALFVLDPLRVLVGRPIHVDSGYRCPELNKAVGGAWNSQHLEGNAADLIIPDISVLTFNQIIRNPVNKIPFDQLINEYGRWNHVSYNGEAAGRKMCLKINKGTGYVGDPI